MVRGALKDDRTVMTKSSAVDLVTQTDQKVEQLIIQSVKEKFPTHRYIMQPKQSCREASEISHLGAPAAFMLLCFYFEMRGSNLILMELSLSQKMDQL